MMYAIISLFKNMFNQPEEIISKEEFKVDSNIPFKKWTLEALKISASFESEDGLPQVTGDFDGCGLTCGYLGWTMRWKNQTNIVDSFVRKHGDELAKKYMPTIWPEYKKIIYMKSDSEMISAVSSWSKNEIVKEPYLSELKSFWRSPEMIEIQVQFAGQDQGQFALKMAQKTSEHLKIPISFMSFAFWFDWCVLNGPYKIPSFNDIKLLSIENVLNWSPFGYGYPDLKKNNQIWLKLLKENKISHEQEFLMKLAFLRAQTSRPQFRPIVMNRRGAVCLGTGFVNGSLRNINHAC